jgi:hypothetical protein
MGVLNRMNGIIVIYLALANVHSRILLGPGVALWRGQWSLGDG